MKLLTLLILSLPLSLADTSKDTHLQNMNNVENTQTIDNQARHYSLDNMPQRDEMYKHRRDNPYMDGERYPLRRRGKLDWLVVRREDE